MKVLVSGATGFVGRYIVEGLLSAGYPVIVGGRTPPPADLFSRPVDYVPLCLDPGLDQIDSFIGATYFVHAAFDHLPGKYRGGEGNDLGRFLRLNLDGTARLVDTARRAGVSRAVFLSSRAVYDGQTSLSLSEDMQLSPDTAYGHMKLECERAFAASRQPGFATASLRLTGVYGGLRPNKWDRLFADYHAGRAVPLRAGTEVHGGDVAAAVRLMFEIEADRIDGRSFNVSDLIVDTRDILGHVENGPYPLPRHADRSSVGIMTTQRLAGLGWQAGGRQRFEETLSRLASSLNAAV